jgi:hypothetical protein
MLPFSMFSSQSSQSSSPTTAFPSLGAPSPLRCRCGASAPQLFPRFCSGGSLDPYYSSSPRPTLSIPKSFTMCSSAKCGCNPCRMRSFKTRHLKPFRMCSCKKNGEGPVAQTSVCAPRSFAARACTTRRNPCNPFPFMGLLHDLRTPRVGGAISQASSVGQPNSSPSRGSRAMNLGCPLRGFASTSHASPVTNHAPFVPHTQ